MPSFTDVFCAVYMLLWYQQKHCKHDGKNLPHLIMRILWRNPNSLHSVQTVRVINRLLRKPFVLLVKALRTADAASRKKTVMFASIRNVPHQTGFDDWRSNLKIGRKTTIRSVVLTCGCYVHALLLVLLSLLNGASLILLKCQMQFMCLLTFLKVTSFFPLCNYYDTGNSITAKYILVKGIG